MCRKARFRLGHMEFTEFCYEKLRVIDDASGEYCNLILYLESAQPRNRSVVTRPFPRRRAGSEYETKRRGASRGQTVNKGRYV